MAIKIPFFSEEGDVTTIWVCLYNTDTVKIDALREALRPYPVIFVPCSNIKHLEFINSEIPVAEK